MKTINIKPSARILKVLGDIEFEDWQCLAELVDNGFDDFLEIKRGGQHWSEPMLVGITLPTGVLTPESEIIVTDTGRGMDLTTLNNAVRAGWSGNDAFSKLGLFGMGFNVATARLGRVTKVLTTRRGETEWTGVRIDLDAMRDDFEAPVITESKASVEIHGTRVHISRLDPTRAGWLLRNQAATRKILGDIYGYLLAQEGFSLLINGVSANPRRACRWDETRSVTFGSGTKAEEIPAYLAIDQAYPPAETCMRCRNWQVPGLGHCSDCGHPELVRRSRRIHGWLGIQRYLHKTEFGIDFFRNGRKILRQDKRLFHWQNPNDPLAATEVEYPVELGQGGRIIGEIHLDHVPVNYQKDAFEWGDRSWRAAVEYIRGTGPLLPQRAKQAGYLPNESPMARLHKGYRRNDPGYRYLIPGDGQGPIHDKTRKWSERFHDGDVEFQTDAPWWAAVVSHETQLAGDTQATTATVTAGMSPVERLGLSEVGPVDRAAEPSGATIDTPTPPETETQRLSRYRAAARQVPSLSGEFGLLELGAAIKLTTFEIAHGPVLNPDNERTPVLLAREPGNAYSAFVDRSHPVFEDFADDPVDLLLVEIADHLRTRAESRIPLPQIVALLKGRHFVDRKVDHGTSASRARELLRTIRERMADAVRDNPDRAWQFLNPDERTSAESTLVNEGSHLTLAAAQESGDLLLYCPAMFLPRLLEEWPEAFMDGAVFLAPFATVNSPVAKRVSIARVAGYLYDVARLASVDVMPTKTDLVRARHSLTLLASEITPDPTSANA